MPDYGFMTVTGECPQAGCNGTDDVRVYGSNGSAVSKAVVCSTCGAHYTVKATITVSAAAVSYDLTL